MDQRASLYMEWGSPTCLSAGMTTICSTQVAAAVRILLTKEEVMIICYISVTTMPLQEATPSLARPLCNRVLYDLLFVKYICVYENKVAKISFLTQIVFVNPKSLKNNAKEVASNKIKC